MNRMNLSIHQAREIARACRLPSEHRAPPVNGIAIAVVAALGVIASVNFIANPCGVSSPAVEWPVKAGP